MSDLQPFTPESISASLAKVSPPVGRIELGSPIPGEEHLIWQGHPSFAYSALRLFRSAMFFTLWGALFFNSQRLLDIPEARRTIVQVLNGAAITPETLVHYASFTLIFFMLLNFLRFVKTLLWHVNTLYRITTQRIIIRTGILIIRANQVELFRLKDYQVTQSLWGRLCGYARLDLVSSDRLLQIAVLWGLPNGHHLSDMIRKASQVSRAQSGSVTISE